MTSTRRITLKEIQLGLTRIVCTSKRSYQLRQSLWSTALHFGLVILISTTIGQAQTANVFRHGVAIHDAMNWASIEAGPSKLYSFPPFSDAKHGLTRDELTIIRRAGFDFIRLTIDPGPFLQFQGAQRDATYNILRERVQMALAANLSVIVDFHPVSQVPDYAAKAFVQGVDTSAFRGYCDMLARTARLLDGLRTNRVALELMNEPPLGWTAQADAQWQAIEEHAYAAVRAATRNLTLVLTGDRGGSVDGLLALDPKPFSRDDLVIYTFHYYLPYEFTHQSLPTDPDRRIAADISYPAQSKSMSDEVAALNKRLDELDQSPMQRTTDFARGIANLLQYRTLNFGRNNIHADFDRVAAWASANRIPFSRIFLGEFGTIRKYGRYKGAADSDRVRWLRDVREEAESHRFFWSIWVYRGYGGGAIVKDDTTDEIDPVTLESLGLLPVRR